MSLSEPFIARPVATTLLAIGLTLAGALAYTQLSVAPLPQVDYPVISVSATLPGANPDTMAATVATPLERQLGRIAGVNEITSSSSLGSTRVVLQFDAGRAEAGGRGDLIDPGDAPELPLEWCRHGRRHGVGVRARQGRRNRDDGVVDLRQRRH